MCIVYNNVCPCWHDRGRGATLPCPNAFVPDSRARNHAHLRKLLLDHNTTCRRCRKWSNSDEGPRLAATDCQDQKLELQEGMYQVLCMITWETAMNEHCCRGCSGSKCIIPYTRGSVLQETSASSEKVTIIKGATCVAVSEATQASTSLVGAEISSRVTNQLSLQRNQTRVVTDDKTGPSGRR